MTIKKMNFAVEDIQVIDSDVDKSQFSLLSVDCFATGKSAHDTFVTEETLKRTARTILQKPFVFAIDKRFDDLGTHQTDEIAGGFVPHNSPITFKKLPDGRTMMNCQVLIWKRYSGDLLKYFSRDGGKKSVSVEIEVLDSREDPFTGLLELVDYVFNAITGLGDLVSPAIPNAEAVFQFAKEFQKDKEKYLFSSKYDDIDFTIPKSVRNNAKKALESKKGSSVALAMGRFLSSNEKINPERVRQLSKFLNRKKEIDEVTLGLYGGKSSYKWVMELMKQLDDIDSKKLSYFNDGGEIMPYQSLEDINPALKGITPPISLAQANAIAKQADAVGTDEEKNGWAIAISNFKKTHVVKDGHWISKGSDNADFAEEENKEENDQMKKDELETKKEEMAVDTPKEEEKETPKEEKAESPVEEKKEEEKGVEEKFSLDAYVDVMAALGFLKNTTDVNEEMAAKMRMAAEEMEKFAANAEDDKQLDYGKVMGGMYAAMCHAYAKLEKLAEDSKTYMAENEELKKFKADIEKEKKQFAVDSFLSELSGKVVIPEDFLKAMREKAEEFSFATIDGWKNHCKAISFDFAAKEKEKDEDGYGVITYARPFNEPVKTKEDLWAGQN